MKKKTTVRTLVLAAACYGISTLLFCLGTALRNGSVPFLAALVYGIVPTLCICLTYRELEKSYADYAENIRKFFDQYIDKIDKKELNSENVTEYILRGEHKLSEDNEAIKHANDISRMVFWMVSTIIFVPASAFCVAIIAKDIPTVLLAIVSAMILTIIITPLSSYVIKTTGYTDKKFDEYCKPVYAEAISKISEKAAE